MKKLICIILFITLISFVFADMGPKPTVNFTITYESQPIEEDFYAKMLSCQTENQIENDAKYNEEDLMYVFAPALYTPNYEDGKDCVWYPARFAWGGECKESKCNFGYHPPTNFKLAVYLPDLNKVFISSETTNTKFDSVYSINLLSSGTTSIKEELVVTERQSISLIVALILTIIIELGVGAIIFFKRYSAKLFGSIVLMNIISLPIFWIILLPFFSSWMGQLIGLLFCELIVFLFEGILLKLINKELSWKRVIASSFAMNLASFFIGGFVLLILTMIFGIGLYI